MIYDRSNCMLPNEKVSKRFFTKMDDLFDHEFVKSIGIYPSQMHDISFNRGKKVKQKFAQRVFLQFLYYVTQECINSNKKFISANAQFFLVYVKEMPPLEQDRIHKNPGIYQNVDLLASDFKLYNLVIEIPHLPFEYRYRTLRIGYYDYQELVKKVNEGRRYNPKLKFKMADIMPMMKEKFPELGESVISRIIRHGCKGICREACQNKNVLLENKRQGFSFKIFKNLSKLKRKNVKPE